ncbi:hypothetical protein QNI22_33690 [Cytophagaceae bacterium BD1B2-1]|uniref:Uncharacterized protein n=1 Tax=Xanthocytophaga agilis TaxID=3048010 RepID=A0AAE3RDD5_9BACT|nr:hypothetical protein [Xanthocytophaga agilis]
MTILTVKVESEQSSNISEIRLVFQSKVKVIRSMVTCVAEQFSDHSVIDYHFDHTSSQSFVLNILRIFIQCDQSSGRIVTNQHCSCSPTD